MKKPGYPIRAVSKLTGLSIDTLRAWERRYRIVEPERTERGRSYSEADVQKLRLLRELVDRGYAIGQIAEHTDEELRQIAGQSEKATARRQPAAGATSPDQGMQAMREAIDTFDSYRAEMELSRLAAILSPRDLVHRIVIPLMQMVGEQWQNGAWSVAQEHMTSALMRNLLGSLVRLYARENAPQKLLFVTPVGEDHEFGILAAAMLAAGGGLRTLYLGTSLPAREIVHAAGKSSANIVVCGVKGAQNSQAVLRELREVAATMPPAVELWVGGTESESVIQEIKAISTVFLPDFHAFEIELQRLGARF